MNNKMFRYPPYILGVWLGDGNSGNIGLTNIDTSIINEWKQYAFNEKLKIRVNEQNIRKTDIQAYEEDVTCCYQISAGNIKNQGKHRNSVLTKFKALNLINNKHIPNIYIENSKEVRTELLAGLIDTDGSLSQQSYEITQKNKRLSDDIVKLAKSLGFHTTIKESVKKCTNSKNVNHQGIYYRMNLSINMNTPFINARCDRKKYNISQAKNIFNPKFDSNGDILQTNRIIWDKALHLELVSTVLSFQGVEPNQQIPWGRLYNFNNKLPYQIHQISDALRKQYQIIEKNIEYHNELKTQSTWIVHNPIESEWMDMYIQVYDKLIDNFKKDKLPLKNVLPSTLKNWLHNQEIYKKNNNTYKSKIQLLDILNRFKIKIEKIYHIQKT